VIETGWWLTCHIKKTQGNFQLFISFFVGDLPMYIASPPTPPNNSGIAASIDNCILVNMTQYTCFGPQTLG